MKTNPDDPVNAITADRYDDRKHVYYSTCFQNGLTKRELFAVMAMQGILSDSVNVAASPGVGKQLGCTPEQAIARSAVNFADLLIDALNREEK